MEVIGCESAKNWRIGANGLNRKIFVRSEIKISSSKFRKNVTKSDVGRISNELFDAICKPWNHDRPGSQAFLWSSICFFLIFQKSGLVRGSMIPVFSPEKNLSEKQILILNVFYMKLLYLYNFDRLDYVFLLGNF